MKAKYMLNYFSSIVLLLVASAALSQETKSDTVDVNIAPAPERYGIRVGADLHRLAKGFYHDDYRGFEIVADYRLTKKIYIAGEIGNEDITVDDPQLNITTKGSYFKVGFDFNAYENWLDMTNSIYVGMRYSVSSFNHNLNSYSIYDASGYFDEVTFYPNREYSGLTAHWAEVIGGVKAEILKNLYLGFSLRIQVLLSNQKPDGFDNLYIPGFNRTYDGSFGAGFNYTLSYFIPIYKKAKVKEEAK